MEKNKRHYPPKDMHDGDYTDTFSTETNGKRLGWIFWISVVAILSGVAVSFSPYFTGGCS